MSHVYPSYNRVKLAFERGEGPWLFDAQNERYFDFGAGIAVNSFGHAHPRLASVLSAQASQLWHVSNLYEVPGQEALAQKLCDASFAEYVFFTNSGAEAIECAIKTARRFHFDHGNPRSKIISFDGCFHGRTLAGLAASGTSKMIDGFGPMPEGFVSVELSEAGLATQLDDSTAAILIEPIQGEGGIKNISDDFLKHIRQEADRVGALVIFDEIQCGMGRTGKMFAYEHSGIEPDIMTLAKGIGGGFPLGACLANERTGRTMVAGTHGSTYGGNPLACRVGLEVINMMSEDGFLSHVNKLAGHAAQRLSGIISDNPEIFEELRGEGLMLGLKCKIDGVAFVEAGRQNGVLTVPAAENVVRLLPPLNLTIEELDAGIDLLEKTANEMKAKL